jgi:hypothetical protein
MTLQRDLLMARLDEHQAKALAVIRRGDTLLAPGAEPDPRLLSQSRWELTRILTAYKAFKHHELFNPIIRNGPPDKARLAEQMKRECEALGAEFLDHVARCTNLDIVAHWSSYRPTVATLLAKVRSHMARERWVVDSLLLVNAADRGLPVRMAARG